MLPGKSGGKQSAGKSACKSFLAYKLCRCEEQTVRESKVESAQSIFLDFHFCAVFPHLFLPIRSELNLNALASVSGRKRFIAKERT